MPLTRIAADAFGVVTICLVAILTLLGFLCIVYSFYFRSRIHHQGFVQLSYFSGPWIIRVAFILFAIWWGLGEIIRLTYLRRILHLQWHETVCKCYIVSNLGFAEPCLFLTLVFLLRAPLQKLETGIMSRKWNWNTAGCILLYCLPVFILQLIVVLIGPQVDKNKGSGKKLPHIFTSTAATSSKTWDHDIALCTYPLLISGFLPLRVLFLGLSVLSGPEQFTFEVLAFLAFLALVCCAGVCICMLVYRPVADCLALGNLQDLEARRFIDDHNDFMSLIANQSHLEDYVQENVGSSTGRYSDASTKRGSISFRTMENAGSSTGAFVELSLFSPSRNSHGPGSPSLLGWPMRPPTQVIGP
ncbi:hypothetical protein K1719_021722 [Acacia pycnantha]|nr:hypothetical protein K1719_021722 [Acacia pycnantha]